jgi:hypothetical protein
MGEAAFAPAEPVSRAVLSHVGDKAPHSDVVAARRPVALELCILTASQSAEIFGLGGELISTMPCGSCRRKWRNCGKNRGGAGEYRRARRRHPFHSSQDSRGVGAPRLRAGSSGREPPRSACTLAQAPKVGVQFTGRERLTPVALTIFSSFKVGDAPIAVTRDRRSLCRAAFV